MLRVRLKADGRIVEVLADGSERTMPSPAASAFNGAAGLSALDMTAAPSIVPAKPDEHPAAYARRIRAATHLSQMDFAARIGVPVETVRNWEQGKRSPRGPARALLKIIERAPETAFALLGALKTAH
jgi:putative transcriptional regulator